MPSPMSIHAIKRPSVFPPEKLIAKGIEQCGKKDSAKDATRHRSKGRGRSLDASRARLVDDRGVVEDIVGEGTHQEIGKRVAYHGFRRQRDKATLRIGHSTSACIWVRT
jgi:hypothetical protein